MRGEYQNKPKLGKMQVELPPRARRIRKQVVEHDMRVGTTSACAENTHYQVEVDGTIGNYLRVRGEYGAILLGSSLVRELPPRARRILEKPR